MARFAADQASNYGGSGGGGFFRLADDGDVAKVRFMYNDINDVVGDSVHEIEVPADGGKTKKKYLAELQAVKDAKEKNEKWAILIASCVFRRTYGNWERVEGNILYVKD